MKTFLIIFAFFFFSCSNDVPNPASEDIFDNPLDEEEVEYYLPALTFYPVEVNASAGGIFTVDVFAMGFDNLAGANIRVSFDENRVESSSGIPGTVFQDTGQDPIFFSELNAGNGWINITTSFLGNGSSSVNTSAASIAQLTFTATTTGESQVLFGAECEMVDPNDEAIEVKGYGEATIIVN